MKHTVLMLSTALAGIMLLAPAMTTAADAAGIKIKPQVVKVKPKIAAARPKLKVKAAKLRIKPKVKVKAARIKPRIKLKPAKPKLVARIKVQPKVRTVLQVRPRVKPQLATVPALKRHATIVKPKPRPATRIVAAPKQRAGSANLARLGSQAGLQDAMRAAQGADAARKAAGLGKLRTGATVQMGLASPNLTPGAAPTNRDILNGMTKKPGRNNLADNTPGSNWANSSAARFGPDSFAGLPNTHGNGPANANHGATGSAAKGFLGVTPGRIAAGMGQIAGDRTTSHTDGTVTFTKTVHDNGQVTQTKTEDIYRGSDGRQIGSIETSHTSGVSDPTTRATDTLTVRGPNGYFRTRESGSGWTGTDVVYNPHGSSWETGHDHTDPFERYPSTLERRDPDSGHGGTSPLPWINDREKQTANISPLIVIGSPGALPQDPAQGNTQPQQVERTVTQNDVLERYDEDSRGRGEPTPIDRSRIQSD